MLQKLRTHNNKILLYTKTKQLWIIILLLITFIITDNIFSISLNFDNNRFKQNILVVNDNNTCNKWIVMTTFNPPSSFIIKLESIIEDWKIVVIGNSGTDDKKWNIFKSSNKLFYLSIEVQNILNFSITKHLKLNSYFRKTIGYLYAIQHGAKEIYEIEDNLEFNDTSYLSKYFDNSFVSYGIRNDSLMINPYLQFGEKNIWPRGFKLNDIGKQFNQEFNIINSSNIDLKPLIFQGLINLTPDIDSIFDLTRLKYNHTFNFNFSKSYPLIYFPYNYIPINSKNTKYLYNIFPLLMFPISFDESEADIWRGYIIQYFAWKMKGIVIYYSSDAFKRNEAEKNISFKKEKKNYFNLNEFLELLNSLFVNVSQKPPLEIINDFIKMLFNNNIIQKQDIQIFKAYLKDLNFIGYNFSFFSFHEIQNNYSNYLKVHSELKIYKPSNFFIIQNKNLNLLNHYFSKKVYEDILLIVNYNHKGFLQLNNYIKQLYNKYFPNIVFIYPSKTKMNNTFSCKESHKGYFSYKCIIKIYQKYPKYKGYLYINDDVFLKIWEIQNFDFDIPWLFHFGPLNKKWVHYFRCNSLYNLIEKKPIWKNNLIQFNGYFDILQGLSDFYYIPNYYSLKISNLFKSMFKSRIFLECAVPTSMAILSSSKYQIIFVNPLWGRKRKKVKHFFYSQFDQIAFHPIKFSKENSKNYVNQYIFFINAIE